MQAVMLDVHCNAIAMRGVAKSAQQRPDRARNVCGSMKHVEINLRMLATSSKFGSCVIKPTMALLGLADWWSDDCRFAHLGSIALSERRWPYVYG